MDVCKLILESLQKENLGSIQPTFAVDGQICKLNIENPMNDFGYTPFDMAEGFGRSEVCEYIYSFVKKENPAAEYWTVASQFVKQFTIYICLKVWQTKLLTYIIKYFVRQIRNILQNIVRPNK